MPERAAIHQLAAFLAVMEKIKKKEKDINIKKKEAGSESEFEKTKKDM